MPVIGWFYARVIQQEAPVAFLALMGGHTSAHFIFKMGLILTFLVIGGLFVVKRWPRKATAWATTGGLLIVLGIIEMHPSLMWLGRSALAWRLSSTVVVLGLIGWIWARRAKGSVDVRTWQWAMFVAGLAAFFAFAMGGFVRERSKSPDTVYGEIVKPELTSLEADRYLVYTKWLEPRGQTAADLDRNRPKDWREEVQKARQGGLELTDEEAERIISYLEAHHR
jgi:hypothetical protein